MFVWMVLGFATIQARAADTLRPTRTLSLPGDGGDPIGSFPDGRIVCVTPDANVHIETSAGSGVFEIATRLSNADLSSFGPAFTRVSPDGNWLAVGNGGGAGFSRFEVGVFNTSDFSGRWFGRLPAGQSGGLLHYSAVWLDNRNLALAGGQFGSPSFVDALDVQSLDTQSPVLTRIVDEIGGASAGIAMDAQGNLVTGNGFSGDGPSQTGSVYAILARSWQAALANNGAPVNFETQGIPIIRTLSAAGMAFDKRGNLWIGGQDFFGTGPERETDFIAVVDAQAYRAVLEGAPTITGSDDQSRVTRLDPDLVQEGQTFFAHLVQSTGEVFVRDTGTNLAYGYVPQASAVPTPLMPAPWLVALGLLMFALPTGRRHRVPATV